MISIRAPGLRYVEPAVATIVASTRADVPAGARSDRSSRLVSSLAARGACEWMRFTVIEFRAPSSYRDLCSAYRWSGDA
jgi:hypothetical protein